MTFEPDSTLMQILRSLPGLDVDPVVIVKTIGIHQQLGLIKKHGVKIPKVTFTLSDAVEWLGEDSGDNAGQQVSCLCLAIISMSCCYSMPYTGLLLYYHYVPLLTILLFPCFYWTMIVINRRCER